MELWIRSQDKEILLKVNELEIEANMIIAFDNNTYQCLGTYKTKERALEVLDEIQELLLGNTSYRVPSNAKICEKTNKLVYEMPEE